MIRASLQARLAVLLLLLALSGCGMNLTIRRVDTELHGTDGSITHVWLERQRAHGAGHDGSPDAAELALGVLFEPVDWLLTASALLHAPFDDRRRTCGGPFGYLAALTPFATVVDAVKVAGPWPAKDVPPDVARRIVAGDVPAARGVFHDATIVGVGPR